MLKLQTFDQILPYSLLIIIPRIKIKPVIKFKAQMVSTNTLKTVPFKIAVVGPPGIGRTTFLNSLLPEGQNPSESDSMVEVQHRDIKNNI